MKVVKGFSSKGPLGVLLDAADLSRSSYYYRVKEGKRGKRPVGLTVTDRGTLVGDSQVVSEIKTLLGKEFVSYGYVKVTHHLRNKGYVINKKKVYRLMREAGLLLPRRIRTKGKREFVKEWVVRTTRPYEYFEMDIKYFWLTGEGRNAYLLSILDLYSRKVAGWKLGRSIRKGDVVGLLKALFASSPRIKGVTIRTDNGSQFLAHTVRDYLKEMCVTHEFTHVGTPEENGHIEAFHSILETEVVRRFEYETLEELEAILIRYMIFYNTKRLHSSLNYRSPDQFLEDYYRKKTQEDKWKTSKIDWDLKSVSLSS